MGVSPSRACRSLVIVAHHAGRLPGIRDRVFPYCGESAGTIVPELPKLPRNHRSANRKEDPKSGQQYDCRSYQVSAIPKQPVHAAQPSISTTNRSDAPKIRTSAAKYHVVLGFSTNKTEGNGARWGKTGQIGESLPPAGTPRNNHQNYDQNGHHDDFHCLSSGRFFLRTMVPRIHGIMSEWISGKWPTSARHGASTWS